MKVNPGILVTMALAFFMAYIGFLVFKSFNVNVDLVTEDYYEKELAYQGQIEKRRNTSGLKSSVSWQIRDHNLLLTFPEEHEGKIKGNITFYRPSDAALDKSEVINTRGNNFQSFPLSNFRKGGYVMQVDWQHKGKQYYHEENIYLP